MTTRRGTGRRKPRDPRVRAREIKEKQESKMATQALVIGGIVIVLLFGFIALSSSGDDEVDTAPKTRSDPLTAAIPDDRLAKPDEESQVPYWLATQFMIALANEDADALDKIIWWEKFFSRLEDKNRIDPEKRYVNLDEAGKEALRQRFLIGVMDPDYIQLIRENILEDLMAGKIGLFSHWDVQADYGKIVIPVEDRKTGKKKLDITVTAELLPDFDPIRDAQNRQAWKIVGLAHEQYGKVKNGLKVRSKQKDFGAEVVKPKKKKRKKRGPKGPPEADPAPVPWLADTPAETRAKVQSLIGKILDLSHPREGDQARRELVELEKAAIPGILTALAPFNHKDNQDDISKAWLLVQVLREITFKEFGYGPGTTSLGMGRGGMVRATPEERVRAIRRWFGWWKVFGPAWDRAVEIQKLEEASEEDDGTDNQ